MSRPVFTSKAMQVLSGLNAEQQAAVVLYAITLSGEHPSVRTRSFYTAAQWTAKQSFDRRLRRDRRKRQLDFAFGVHKGHGNPWESKAPRGWRPSAKEARLTAKVFAR